ncbi:MAG: hypothetical protein JO225_11175 [Candidatus Eremiobacteraeota bacterium]|nr:hypothetical protein [Candidatus Eremiobacteraeota bacterium]
MKSLPLLLAAVFVIIAILYWTGHFIPSGVHTKHGIVAAVLALLCLVWYRFQSAGATR